MTTSSYLLIADGTIEQAWNTAKINQLKAYLKHAFLFEERVVLSDAQIISNRNLRTLFRQDPEFLDLFDKSSFALAIRDSADYPLVNGRMADPVKMPDLVGVLDSSLAFDKGFFNGKSRIPDTDEEYRSQHELRAIEKRAKLVRFDGDEVSRLFSDDVYMFFQDDDRRLDMGLELRAVIREMIHTKRVELRRSDDPNAGLGIAFFQHELPDWLTKAGFSEQWQSQKQAILEAASACHLTNLPKRLQATPVYGSMHKSKVELMRKADWELQPILDAKMTRSRLSKFEQGILRLSTGKIQKLRDSQEFKHFRETIALFNGTQDGLHEIVAGLTTYKDLIDRTILAACHDLDQHRDEPALRFQWHQMVWKAPALVSLGLGTGAFVLEQDKLPGVELAILCLEAISLLIEKAHLQSEKKQDRLDAVKESIAVQEMVNEWENDGTDGQIDAIHNVGYPSKPLQDVFYKSLV